MVVIIWLSIALINPFLFLCCAYEISQYFVPSSFTHIRVIDIYIYIYIYYKGGKGHGVGSGSTVILKVMKVKVMQVNAKL